MTARDPLWQYYILGSTGMRVSPLALGTMTFGNREWGANEEVSRTIFHHYINCGGNFVDTANAYADGTSEALLGKFIEETGNRDELVLATKFTAPRRQRDPNAGGNGRKNIIASLDESLRRLRTDYIDLYWLHIWDTLTPAEEVMSTLDTLVRAGRVRAIGLSDVPAWYAAKSHTIAQIRGWEPLAALQLQYSLVERNIEREHVPAAVDLGVSIVPWSPLANGFLAGKYARGSDGVTGEGRVQTFGSKPDWNGHSDTDWHVLDTLLDVASALERSPAQVALNWITGRPGVASTLVGARTVDQLLDNIAALEFSIPDEHVERLEEAGRPEIHHPYDMHLPEVRRFLHGGTIVSR
ncbi:aldo/keto reductase [Phytoactinopolyspora halotolerans]|uniref:Aldo/keto reductase n=1 Tax=Phytoactinopolyspora halotolerans TaxID=1981512 RepID=A0A6L9SFN9_9ACTN|nr:aldo/keto reductase [Phytoactinopolyspora halotolerans]NEE03913.1 aldo/keto reductase [Phytoactinopolyspora halotolerans]